MLTEKETRMLLEGIMLGMLIIWLLPMYMRERRRKMRQEKFMNNLNKLADKEKQEKLVNNMNSWRDEKYYKNKVKNKAVLHEK